MQSHADLLSIAFPVSAGSNTASDHRISFFGYDQNPIFISIKGLLNLKRENPVRISVVRIEFRGSYGCLLIKISFFWFPPFGFVEKKEGVFFSGVLGVRFA